MKWRRAGEGVVSILFGGSSVRIHLMWVGIEPIGWSGRHVMAASHGEFWQYMWQLCLFLVFVAVVPMRVQAMG